MRQLLGPRNHEATDRVVREALATARLVGIMRFLNGYGFLLFLMTHRNEGHWVWDVTHFPTTLFSTAFDTGHGIIVTDRVGDETDHITIELTVELSSKSELCHIHLELSAKLTFKICPKHATYALNELNSISPKAKVNGFRQYYFI